MHTHLNTNLQSVKPSATLLINERSKRLLEAGKKVYRLGFGQSPFPVPDSVCETLKKHASEKDYLPVKGLPTLRKAVAQFNKRTLNMPCDAAQVMIGPGSKELIFNCQLAFSGDILLPSPSWVSYEPQAQLLQKKVWWIDTTEADDWRLNPKALDEVCQNMDNPNKLLILNYPNNPTGVSYSPEQLKALADILRKHNVIVIADEIYGEVSHSAAHHSLATYYPEATIVSSGLSKWCGAGGWRLGTFTFPVPLLDLQDAMSVIASETFSAVSAPIQYAAVTAFTGNEEIDLYVQHSNAILKLVGYYMYNSLTNCGVTMPKPEGGFYLFPNFTPFSSFLKKKNIHNSKMFCEYLLEETGVALLPGTAFGRPENELTARLSFVDFDGKKALKEYKNDMPTEVFMREFCPNIVEAAHQLTQWLTSQS